MNQANKPINNNKEEAAEEIKETAFSLEEIEKCLKERDEYLAGWQRARADFINYKKEESERINNFARYRQENFILKILSILDNFEIAQEKVLEELKDNETIKGFIQIKKQLEDFLKSENVQAINSLGEKFDHNFHEAIDQVEIKDKESGIIIEEIQKGYIINDRLLRPAKVRVNK